MRSSLVFVTVLAGCAAPVEPEARPAEPASTSVHVVTTRVIGATDRTTARAAFVRVLDARSIDSAARTLGLEPDLPDVGECRAADSARATPTSAELLDAGEVWLGDREHATRLVARAFPDVLGVSGVVYTTPGDTARVFDRDAWVRYGGAAQGGERVEVSLGLSAPTLGATRVADGVAFEPAAEGDRTWLDIADAQGSRRCTVAPDARWAEVIAAADAVVTVHRDRRRVDGAVTVRAEVVEVLTRPVAPSGS